MKRSSIARERRHVVLVGNYAPSILNFRGPFIDAVRAEGHRVTACAPEASETVRAELHRRGVGYRDIRFNRGGTSPSEDFALTVRLVRLFRELRPDVVLTYTIKPIVYGSIAAALARVPLRATMMSGLGYTFTSTTKKARVVRTVVSALYRAALPLNHVVFFHNQDDRAYLAERGLVPSGRKIVVVGGSGVDTEHFKESPLPQGAPVFLLIARLLPDKGIREYVEAARRVRRDHPDVRVQLLGPLDPQPGSITKGELAEWRAEGAIEYLGQTEDVRPFIEAATVYVLPSYREGMPRSVLEAMAMGRPVITSDAPGCRHAVRDEENGVLVPVGQADGIERAMRRFVSDPGLAVRFGAASRVRAVEHFDARKVAADMVDALSLRCLSRRTPEASVMASPRPAT